MIEFKEALNLIKQQSIELPSIDINIEDALSYYLAEDVKADRDYPPFNRAAMDGFAVNTEWYNTLDKKAMVSQGKCFAGEAFTKTIDSSKALKIMTGSAVPEGLDAIIKIEDCDASCDLITFNQHKIAPWLSIAKKGEDIAQNEIILPKGTHLSAVHIQALATVGVSTIKVYGKPKIALITTGNEVRGLDESVNGFQIRNSNEWSVSSSLKELGYEITFSKHVSDDIEATKEALHEALKTCDLILFTGGVSMGDADFIPSTLTDNGIKNIFHKVAIKPGKPVWFGSNDTQIVFGLPGNPLSAFQDFHLFVKPLLAQVNGNTTIHQPKKGILHNDISDGRIDRFLPFYWQEGELSTKKFNGSGDITTLIDTSGMIFVPKGTSYKKGDIVQYYSY